MTSRITLDPEEEYVIMPLSVLEKLVRYALSVCQEQCPMGRDPSVCPYIVSLSRFLGLGEPPCVAEYGGFNREAFQSMIRDLEKKYKMKIEEFVKLIGKRKPRSLEEQSDYMEATFYIGVLNELKHMKRIYLAKGSDINVERAQLIR